MASYPMFGFGTDGPADEVPARHARRPAARGVRAVGGPGGLGHRRHDQPGQAGGRGLRPQRGQGLDHPRRARPTSTPPSSRTGEGRPEISCFHLPGPAPGLSFGAPEHKMGLTASPTTALYFDAVHVDDDQLIGAEGQGMKIALSALDSGRLGIAACATGLAQAALDLAVAYAKRAAAVRPADRGVPGGGVPAGRDGGRGRHGPGLLSGRRRASGTPAGRSPGTPRWPRWWPPTPR